MFSLHHTGPSGKVLTLFNVHSNVTLSLKHFLTSPSQLRCSFPCVCGAHSTEPQHSNNFCTTISHLNCDHLDAIPRAISGTCEKDNTCTDEWVKEQMNKLNGLINKQKHKEGKAMKMMVIHEKGKRKWKYERIIENLIELSESQMSGQQDMEKYAKLPSSLPEALCSSSWLLCYQLKSSEYKLTDLKETKKEPTVRRQAGKEPKENKHEDSYLTRVQVFSEKVW